jgi:hypothetical protein
MPKEGCFVEAMREKLGDEAMHKALQTTTRNMLSR